MLFFVLILLVLVLIYFYLYAPYDHWKKRGIPSTSTRSLLGDIPSTLHHKKHLVYEFDPIYEKFKDRYNYIGLFVLRQPQILITSPEAAKTVLVSQFKNFKGNFFSQPVSKETDKLHGRHPFNLNGDEWKDKRTELAPGFASNRVKAAYPLIENVCEKLRQYIDQKLSENPMNVKDVCARYTAEVVTNMIYGLDAGCFDSEKPVILENGRNFISGSNTIWHHLALRSFLPFFSKFYKTTYANKPIEQFFIKLMKDALKVRQESNEKKLDFLDHVLEMQNKKNLNILDSAASGTIFFFDGFDTSSTFMYCTLYELAKNPEIQNNLRSEIENVKGELTYDKVENLPYLEQVISESARLHPPITMAVKLCTERTELPLNDKEIGVIEPGTVVNVPIYSILKDARYFVHPDKFDPDRFSVENGGTKKYRDEGSFIPFGDGPRICIGMKFATAQVKRGIVEIIENYRLTLNSRTEEPLSYLPKALFFVSTTNDVWLNFEKIE